MNEMTVYSTIARIDTTSAPKVQKEIQELLDQGVLELVLDMENTTYISSVGLRILLTTQKYMNSHKGTMVLRHVREQVKEIFDVTGFSGFLTLED